MDNKYVPLAMQQAPPGSILPTPMIAVVSLPFLLLGWLLFSTISGDLRRFAQVDLALDVFAAGLAVIEPLEGVRDLAPASIYVGTEDVAQSFNYLRRSVDSKLPLLEKTLRRLNRHSFDGYADQLAESWLMVAVSSPNNDIFTPFDNVRAFENRVYDALSATLYVSNLSVGDGKQISELLLTQQDTLRNARQNLGALRSLALYTALRGGYLASPDADRLDRAWLGLEQNLQMLESQAGELRIRDHAIDAGELTLTSAKDWLAYTEEEMILADVILLDPVLTYSRASEALDELIHVSDFLLVYSRQVLNKVRIKTIARDLLLAMGLLLLYGLVVAFAVLFYRSRYRLMHSEAENVAKSQFLARMSHEIRTPLNGVIGVTELLRETEPNRRQREYINLIDSAGRTLLELVNDILDFARIEAGKVTLVKTSFELRPLVAECAHMFSLSANDHGSMLLYLLDDGVPEEMEGDPVRLRQVLINLLSNAVKFTENGCVFLRVSVPTLVEGSRVRFEVTDSGIGMSQQEQEKLFEVFSQVSAEVSSRYGGSGLGLSISRELVRLMGGDIRVSSAPNKGSSFWFDVPGIGVEDATEGTPVHRLCTHKVLLFDPSGLFADLLRDADLSNENIIICSQQTTLLDWLDSSGKSVDLMLVNGVHMSTDILTTVEQMRNRVADVPLRVVTGIRAGLPATLRRRYGITEVVSQSVFSGEQLWALLQPNRLRETEPVEALEVEANNQKVYAERPPMGRRVLVAEDNVVNQMVTLGYLKKLGLEADVVDDGARAVEKYRDNYQDYQLILMDLDMPEMNGAEATHRIRKLEKEQNWPRCPVVALSAHVFPEYAVLAKESGVDAQLVKPVSLESMADTLAEYLLI